MITYSGRSVWPTWTKIEGVPTNIGPTLDDIAVGLGRQSRFAGQTREFYTVLCHSIVCGEIARKFFPDATMLRRHLLLHDGHEAMIADVPSPWKNDQTRLDEAEIDRRIAVEHGLEPLSDDDLERLKQVDGAALAAEAHALGHFEAEKWWPRDGWDDMVVTCFALTHAHLVAGNPVRYLEPRNAIDALKRALEG